MNDLEAFLERNNRVWYNSIKLINKYGRDKLNELYTQNKIEVRNGINCKVIKYKN